MSIKIYSYEIISEEKTDEETEDIKRVEIGLHTKMSSQEGFISAKEYFKEAKKRGYDSLGFMDKNVVQSYPEIMDAAIETGIKPLYGVEANLFDDTKTLVNNYKGDNKNTFVVFDVETTGFSAADDRVIEMGAVKIKFVNTPAIATKNVPFFLSLKLFGFIITGFAHPNLKNIKQIVPIGSRWCSGFKESLPSFLAVSSPHR